MKIRVYASVGLVGCKVEETINIDDEEADDEELIEEIAKETAMQMIEWGYEVVSEEES